MPETKTKTEELLEKMAEKLAALETSGVEREKTLEERMEAQKADYEKKIEEILKAKADIADGSVPDEDEQKERGKYYGYANARKETARGRTSPVPYWDDKTEKRFVEYMIAVKERDTAFIKKTFGDNVLTETTSAGGYLIPTEFRAELVRLVYQRSLMLPKVTIIPMSSGSLTMPSRTAGYTVSWGTINTQITDTKLTLGQVSHTAKKMVALSIVPNELLQDSALPVGSLIADEFTEGFAQYTDKNILMGDTGDTDGNGTTYPFNGWAGGVTTNDNAGDTGDSVATEITAANLYTIAGMLDEIEIQGAQWFFHPTVWATVRGLTDSNGDHLVRLNQAYRYDVLGFPTNLSSQMTTKASIPAGGPWVLFGNPRYIQVGDQMSLEIAQSQDVRFDYDQTVFRGIQRLSIAVAIEGALAQGTRGPAS